MAPFQRARDIVRRLPPNELHAVMSLVQDIVSATGAVILSRGHQLTAATDDRINGPSARGETVLLLITGNERFDVVPEEVFQRTRSALARRHDVWRQRANSCALACRTRVEVDLLLLRPE